MQVAHSDMYAYSLYHIAAFRTNVPQSPLSLSFFSTVVPALRIPPALLWTSLDAVGAWALVNIWRSRSNIEKSKRDLRIAAMYVLNLTILACISSSLRLTPLFQQLPPQSIYIPTVLSTLNVNG